MTSRLAVPRKRHRHPQFEAWPKGSASRLAAPAGDCRWGSAGSWSSRLCSRTVFVLQKPTSGARPFAPAGEESADNDVGSSGPARERWAVKKRRKPDRRRPSHETGGGFPKKQRRESVAAGDTCRGKALWAGKTALFDASAVAAALVPREVRSKTSKRAGCDRERQRSNASVAPGRECPRRRSTAHGRRSLRPTERRVWA